MNITTPFFFHSYFWELYFTGYHVHHFYEALVWGNVWAILPCGIIAFLYVRSKHLAIVAAQEELKAAHISHAEKFNKLLDKLDPESDGGIQEIHDTVQIIKDQVDENTPGGIKTVLDKIDKINATKGLPSP